MKKTTIAILVVIATGINSAIWLALKNHPGISAENGPMENFQAACLIGCSVFWLIAALRSNNPGEKILRMSLALFHFSFFILEVDLRHLDVPVLNKLFNGKIRDAWLGTLWISIGICFLKNRMQTWRAFLLWIKSPSGIVLILSGIFWFASGLIDKSLTGRKELYDEELMEVNATLLMALSAILSLQKAPQAKLENVS